MRKAGFDYIFLIYCIQKQSDGRYVFLNRDYSPVGFALDGHVNYEDYPCLFEVKGLTPARATEISHSSSDDVERIYLYNDGCSPWKGKTHWDAYCERVKVLNKLKLS